MQPDIQRIQQLAQLAHDLAAAAPQKTPGSDRTGWVKVVLGADGVPTEIRVRESWRQRLDPEELAGAVLEANTDAVREGMRAWTDALDDGGWWQHRTALEDDADEQVASPPLPPGQARDSNDLAEEVISRLQSVQAAVPAQPADHEGRDDDRRVVIRIGASGLSGCVIDADWAKGRDGAVISVALAAALRRAVSGRPDGPKPEHDDLVGDALTTLNSLRDER